ncbi:DUF3040 domain-containing protein [Actinomadura sediminis]|uniref:DUF3040 domain-containing protein n=1 Tax=Actinomadura sediminis TaxID=1038904 RepID=A0ABW3ETA9_9ACTN
MRLSRREQVLLRRIDTRLEREDPLLAHRLTTFTPPGDPPVAWRPPRAAVVIVAVAVAVAVFLMAWVVLSIDPPCRGAGALRSGAASAVPPDARPAGEPPTPAASGSSPTC